PTQLHHTPGHDRLVQIKHWEILCLRAGESWSHTEPQSDGRSSLAEMVGVRLPGDGFGSRWNSPDGTLWVRGPSTTLLGHRDDKTLIDHEFSKLLPTRGEGVLTKGVY